MTEERTETCPICKLEDKTIKKKHLSSNDSYIINCPRCNDFIITYEALVETSFSKDPIPKLSAWIRDFNEKHSDGPEIYRESLEEIPKSLPDYSPREKQIILLKNIERKTEYPGKSVVLTPKYDFPLAWATNAQELVYYLISLQKRGLLIETELHVTILNLLETNNISDDEKFSIAITADGWDYLEKQERHFEERTQAFVAMSFSPDLKPIWEGPIKNAIEKAGYKAYRVDAQPHNELIDFQIISEIKNSRFVVADFTGQKPGVYFEAGYARGIGLPVIWCVRKDDFKNLHFDTNHYNHIQWETPDQLEDQLYQFICEIVGKRKET